MNKDKISFLASLTVTSLGIAFLAYLFFKLLFFALLPFIISWAVAFLLRPLVCFVSKKTRIPRRIVSVVLTVITVFLVIGLGVLLCVLALKEAWEFFSRIAADGKVIDALARIGNPIGSLFGTAEASGLVTEKISEALSEGISGLISRLVALLSGIISRIPGVIFFIVVTVIASVYFALDLDRINEFTKRILPKRVIDLLIRIKSVASKALLKYLGSYLIIMLITFIIILVGLLFLRVRSAILIAALISIFDFLPIIGVGTVLLPWSIAEFIMGNSAMGAGLIILLVAHELVRQFLEPKIVGKSIGVHPVLSLLLLYVGYYTLGFIGILFVPIIAVFVNILFDNKGIS
ncbi:MAG: sporulation integral membrane protein YtvI [Clostridia bacterium]|nr:sporulation integral membrane protein YtvI [Clostridia bacterium]